MNYSLLGKYSLQFPLKLQPRLLRIEHSFMRMDFLSSACVYCEQYYKSRTRVGKIMWENIVHQRKTAHIFPRPLNTSGAASIAGSLHNTP